MKKRFFVAALFSVCAACSAPIEAPDTGPETGLEIAKVTPISGQEQIETALQPSLVVKGDDYSDYTLDQRRAFYGVPSASVAIATGGEIEWAAGYGDRTDSDTLFQAASLSKAVAAAGIATLAAQKGISLDDDLTPLMSSLDLAAMNTSGQPVTLRRLLSHTNGATVSGFPGYPTSGPVPTNLELIKGSEITNTDPITLQPFEEGVRTYSGGGYQIAQAWAEEASGEAFADLMDRLVLQPIGMTQSTFAQPLPPELASQNVADAYFGDAERVEGGWHIYPEQAAAGLWTTPSDYARFMLALMGAAAGDSTLGLDPVVAKEMTTPVAEEYGLGMGLQRPHGDERRWMHSGSNKGYRCTAMAFPERGDVIVVMTNHPRGFPLLGEINRAGNRTYDWPRAPIKEIERFIMSATELSGFTGAYVREGETEILFDVTVNGLDLLAQVRAYDFVFELIPLTKQEFIDPGDLQTARFEQVDGMWVMESGGAKFLQVEE
ncbi:MAG: serine hydrolase domain-containing protein [Pseudomonadota bacterium]